MPPPQAQFQRPFRKQFDLAPTPNEARHALGLALGLHVQPYDLTLEELAALAIVQGDLIYGDGADSLARLAKDANATRYLSNTGTSNNPAWAQVDLTNGVTGDLPFASLAQGSALSVLGVTGNSTADNASIAAGSDHQVLRRSGSAVAFGAVALDQAAAVTGTLPSANGGVDTSAWATYTPTVTASSGTFTSVSATGTSKTIGKTTHLSTLITITTNGTAAGVVRATLPNTASAAATGFSGVGTTGTGLMVHVNVGVSGTFLGVTFPDSTYPGGDGVIIRASITYENT
jgi:hypothetical protein